MGAPRLLAPTTLSGGIPTAGAGTLNTVALWTPDGFTLGNSLLTQAGSIITNATGAIRANGTSQASPAFMRHDATNTGIYFPGLNEIGFTINGNHAMYIASTRHVGIGTTSPDVFSRGYGRILGISSASSAALEINAATANSAIIDLGVNGTRSLTIVSDGTAPSVGTLGSLPLVMSTNGIEAMRILAGAAGVGGNVGIGTASPARRLEISSAAPLRMGAGGEHFDFLQFTTNTWSWLSNAGTYVMTMQTTGNVGIGTTSPLGPLDVRDATVSGLGVTSIYTGAITAGQGGAITFGGFFTGTSPTTWAKIVGGKDNATAGEFGGHLQFLTRPNGGATAERMRIDSTGRILQGTTQNAVPVGVRYTMAYAGSAYLGVFNTSANTGLLLGVEGSKGYLYNAAGALGSEGYTIAATFDTTGVQLGTGSGMVFNASGTQQGLKLPATPGNGDRQTLDSYQELDKGVVSYDWTPTVTFGTGGTVTYTVDQSSATRIGRMVFFFAQISYTVTAAPTGGDLSFTLPATGAAFNQTVGVGNSNATAAGDAGPFFMVLGSSATSALVRTRSGTAANQLAARLTTSSTFTVSGAYQV